MLKSRIILGVFTILMVVGIYALPKVVVENDTDNQVSGQESPEASQDEREAVANAHSVAGTEQIQPVINAYRDSIQNTGNSKKSIIFADSLASLYSRINRPDSAATFIEMIIAESPGVEEWVRGGDAFYEAYGMETDPATRAEYATKARDLYLKVLDEQPSNMYVKNRVAMTWLASPNPMQGILTLREIIQEDPQNEQAIFNLGVLSMQSGQYDKAVERFQQLIEIDRNNIEAHFFLGVSHLELGNKAAAKEEFEFVKDNGDDPAVIADAESYLQSI